MSVGHALPRPPAGLRPASRGLWECLPSGVKNRNIVCKRNKSQRDENGSGASSIGSRESEVFSGAPITFTAQRRLMHSLATRQSSLAGDGNVTVSVRGFNTSFVQHCSLAIPMMARIGCCLALLPGLVAFEARAELPSFLPPYYVDALKYDGNPLLLTSQGDKEGVKRAVFERPGGPVGVTIEQIACERAQCAALLEQNLKRHNERMGAGGAFRA